MVKKAPTEAAQPPVAVFGVPRGGKIPVGARFAPADAALAAWVAHHCGLLIIDVSSPAAAALAASLREGQLHPTRGVLLNVISRPTFENLQALASEGGVRPTLEGDHTNWVPDPEVSAARIAMADPLWASFRVRDVVLSPEYNRQGATEGWWEAVILTIIDDVYTICWLDEVETGFRKRKRHELALIYPTK
ncbi:hypothetical protein [Falsiroseomonas sp. E2-1-a20]|uniref:hypothetical protein n=1 Tax=Falsiroseomonas sp. E2-1-a20 TaxID=3239300 RepID=UPI003F3DB4D8